MQRFMLLLHKVRTSHRSRWVNAHPPQCNQHRAAAKSVDRKQIIKWTTVKFVPITSVTGKSVAVLCEPRKKHHSVHEVRYRVSRSVVTRSD